MMACVFNRFVLTTRFTPTGHTHTHSKHAYTYTLTQKKNTNTELSHAHTFTQVVRAEVAGNISDFYGQKTTTPNTCVYPLIQIIRI